MRAVFPKRRTALFFYALFREFSPGKENSMYSEMIEAYLASFCYGREGITSSQIIEQQLGIDGIDLRVSINQLRRRGVPIASESKGYFYAASYQDLEPTLRHLRHRRAAIDAAIEGLEKAQRELLELP